MRGGIDGGSVEVLLEHHGEYGDVVAWSMNEKGVQKMLYSSACATYGNVEKLPIIEELAVTKPINPCGNQSFTPSKCSGITRGRIPSFIRRF